MRLSRELNQACKVPSVPNTWRVTTAKFAEATGRFAALLFVCHLSTLLSPRCFFETVSTYISLRYPFDMDHFLYNLTSVYSFDIQFSIVDNSADK